MQVTFAVNTPIFHAGNLDNFQTGFVDTQVNECLNFEAVTIDFNKRRRRLKSWLPPPRMQREPLAKSLPLISASTKSGISPRSVDPSASRVTMIAPTQAAKPTRRAS